MANSKPRVLIAAGIYPPDAGGPAVHAKAQFERLKEFGIETGLVALAHYREWPMGVRHLIYFSKLFIEVPQYDLVYAHDTVGAGIPALIAAKIFKKKFIVRAGGDLAWERGGMEVNMSMKEWYESGDYKKSLMFKLSHYLLQRADAIVVVGDSLAELYFRVYEVKRDKIKIILNPIPNLPNFEVKKGHDMVFASRLTSYKNLARVLKSLKELSLEYPELQLTIMGNGPEEFNLKKLTQKLGVENKVTFTGAVPFEEVLKRTAECFITIAPALTEFNPNYVLQGISFGKPFLVSRENDLPFEIPDNLTFDPKNVREIAERIKRLLDDREYERVVHIVKMLEFKMSWEDNLRQNAKLIQSLLNG